MSFDFNILSDLLFTVPFIVGYTRPMYKSQEIYRQALLRGDIYQENLEETKAWQEYQEELRKEEKKGIFASFAGALVGSVIGFFTGGPSGAKIGWNAGKALGRNIRKQSKGYFDATTYLTSNPVFQGGKFNRQLDRANWREAINDAEDRDDMMSFTDLMDLGKGAFIGMQTDWKDFNYKDWRDLTQSKRFDELMESFKVATFKDFLKSMEDRGKDLTDEAVFDTSFGISTGGSGVGFAPDIDLLSGLSSDYGTLTDPIDPLDDEKILKELNKAINNVKDKVSKDPSSIGIELGDKSKVDVKGELKEELKEKEALKQIIGVETPVLPTEPKYPTIDVTVGKRTDLQPKSELSLQERISMGREYDKDPSMIQKDAPSWWSTAVETPVSKIPTFYNKSTGSAMEINTNEWKPMEAMVDNLKDRDWKPMDYDWRVDNDKFLWRDWQPFRGRGDKISEMNKLIQTNLDLTNQSIFEGPPQFIGPPQAINQGTDSQLFDMNKELQLESSLDALEANPLTAPKSWLEQQKELGMNWQLSDTTQYPSDFIGEKYPKYITKFTSEELERARQYISDDWMPDSSINKEAYRYLSGPYTSRYDSMNGLWKGE